MTRMFGAVALGLGLTMLSVAGRAGAASMNGRSGSMPASYDDQLFVINFMELPQGGEQSTLVHNKSINTIYMSDDCMPGGHMFVSVVDAIQGDGFNPLWQEVQVVFDAPAFSCTQFTSDDDIEDAAAVGLVSLEPTTEVYRCSVIGPRCPLFVGDTIGAPS
jgi:hypothetical protein